MGPNILTHGSVLGRLRLSHIGALHSSGFSLGSLSADLSVHRERVGELDQFHISPSPVERPSPDLGLSYRMNELVHWLARLRDSEEAHEEDEREEQSLEGPSGDPVELGNSCPAAALNLTRTLSPLCSLQLSW